MSEDKPPTTVPAQLQVSVRGSQNEIARLQELQNAIIQITRAFGRIMDLRLLDGITIGADYEDALASVDLGYESSIAKDYTKSDGMVGVAKTLYVKRDGQTRAHVVFNASIVEALIDDQHEYHQLTINLVAHELAHVATMGWVEDHTPNVLLQPHEGDWATASLRDAAHIIWDEYAVCRMSAQFGTEIIQKIYAENVELSVGNAFQDSRECIKRYRIHGDLARLLTEVARRIATPLKMSAYLLGHLDGAQSDADIKRLCPTLDGSEFSEFIAPLRQALRKAWNTRHDWKGLQGVDIIVEVLLAAMKQAGIVVTLNSDPPGTHIDVPFTEATMPS